MSIDSNMSKKNAFKFKFIFFSFLEEKKDGMVFISFFVWNLLALNVFEIKKISIPFPNEMSDHRPFYRIHLISHDGH